MGQSRLGGHAAAWLALLGMVLGSLAPAAVASASAAPYKAPSRQALTIADVQKVIAQTVGEAKARAVVQGSE